MDGNNYMLGEPKANLNDHIHRIFGLQQSGSTEDHSETMEEFNEEDIWASVNDAGAKQVGSRESGFIAAPVCRSMGVKEGNNNTSRRQVEIPWKEACHEEKNRRRVRYQSATVNIPDWSQVVCQEKKHGNYWRSQRMVNDDSDANENGNGSDFERIPPHELVARQFSQTDITSFSVYEGIGRTLKGRDLRQVRNAVLTRTGFIE